MTNQIDFKSLAEEIHKIVKDHGFWKNWTHIEKIALMHSELSEALESWRNHEESLFHKLEMINEEPELWVQKPCGWAAELCDCVIRILDFWGYIISIKGDNFLIEGNLQNQILANIENIETYDLSFIDLLLKCHELIIHSYEEDSKEIEFPAMLLFCIGNICAYLETQNIEWQKILREKIEYNRNRSFKHGGKKC